MNNKDKEINEEKTIKPEINLNTKNKEKTKNKYPSILIFFIVILISFLIYNTINPYLYKPISNAILNGRYNKEIIYEMVCFCIIVIVTLLAGNKYIFDEKKKGFFEAIGIGGVMCGYAFLAFLSNSSNIVNNSFINILSLAIYCLFIGLYEEFLCRGWIQNELIERYSSNRKQVLISIILSSLIFGGMHISNIWIGGQGIIETLTQIIQAVGMGVYLGAIYYRTKNIWANAFLHGFWDFAILLGEINTIKLCSEGSPSNSYIISQLITAIILSLIFLILGLYLLRKSKLADRFNYTEDEIKLSEKRKDRLVFIIVVLYFLIPTFIQENENQVCYTYEEKEVTIREKITPVYSKYNFNSNDTNFILALENNRLKIKLTNSEEKEIPIDMVQKFMVVKDKDNYHILVIAYNKYKTDTVLYYSSFLNDQNLSTDIKYINDFISSFKVIESAPTISEIGYFYSELDNTTYPYINSYNKDQLIIYDGELYTIRQKEID